MFKVHGLLYHSTLGSRVIKKKEKTCAEGGAEAEASLHDARPFVNPKSNISKFVNFGDKYKKNHTNGSKTKHGIVPARKEGLRRRRCASASRDRSDREESNCTCAPYSTLVRKTNPSYDCYFSKN